MKRKNVIAGFLLSVATIFLLFSNHTLNNDDLFKNLIAEDNFYEVKLPSSSFMPIITDEHSGFFPTDILNSFT